MEIYCRRTYRETKEVYECMVHLQQDTAMERERSLVCLKMVSCWASSMHSDLWCILSRIPMKKCRNLMSYQLATEALLDHFQSRFDIERDRRGVTSFRNVTSWELRCLNDFRWFQGTSQFKLSYSHALDPFLQQLQDRLRWSEKLRDCYSLGKYPWGIAGWGMATTEFRR